MTTVGQPPASPARVQRRRTAGWKTPAHTKYAGRGTEWGNPYAVQQRGRVWVVVDLNDRTPELRKTLLEFDTKADATAFAVELHVRHTAPGGLYELDEDRVRRMLGGWNLACWCAPSSPCHVDHLLAIANGPTRPP